MPKPKEMKRPFRPKQTVRVCTEQPVKALNGTLVLKPGQLITVFALRFWKAARAWVVRLRDGIEFLANYFAPSARKKRRPKRRERSILRPAYSYRYR